jgi:hypothetical protein
LVTIAAQSAPTQLPKQDSSLHFMVFSSLYHRTNTLQSASLHMSGFNSFMARQSLLAQAFSDTFFVPARPKKAKQSSFGFGGLREPGQNSTRLGLLANASHAWLKSKSPCQRSPVLAGSRFKGEVLEQLARQKTNKEKINEILVITKWRTLICRWWWICSIRSICGWTRKAICHHRLG